MALNKNALKKLNKEFESYDNFTSLFLDIICLNKLTLGMILKCIFLLILAISFSYYSIKNVGFNISFSKLSEISMMLSVGLLGLLIGGFSIVLSSINNKTLYCLILYNDTKEKNISKFKITLLFCVEPLIWFTLLLFLSFAFKILYLIYPSIYIPNELIPTLKIAIQSIIISLCIISLSSLKNFILNIYNIIAVHAKFTVLEKYSEDNGSSLDDVIKGLEENLNSK